MVSSSPTSNCPASRQCTGKRYRAPDTMRYCGGSHKHVSIDYLFLARKRIPRTRARGRKQNRAGNFDEGSRPNRSTHVVGEARDRSKAPSRRASSSSPAPVPQVAHLRERSPRRACARQRPTRLRGGPRGSPQLVARASRERSSPASRPRRSRGSRAPKASAELLGW